jgi:hypothetical protein
MTEIGATKELESWKDTFKSFRTRETLEIAIGATRKQIPLVPNIESDSCDDNGNITSSVINSCCSCSVNSYMDCSRGLIC